jgi:hypothetical protein
MTTLELLNQILNLSNIDIPDLKFEYINGDTINIIEPISMMYSINSIIELFNYLVDNGNTTEIAIMACSAKIVHDLTKEK